VIKVEKCIYLNIDLFYYSVTQNDQPRGQTVFYKMDTGCFFPGGKVTEVLLLSQARRADKNA
jgi:hypothetical protein